MTRPVLGPTIYHTGCKHANHTWPMLEPTIYHTGYEHSNHKRPVFEPAIYHTGCEHANNTRLLVPIQKNELTSLCVLGVSILFPCLFSIGF